MLPSPEEQLPSARPSPYPAQIRVRAEQIHRLIDAVLVDDAATRSFLADPSAFLREQNMVELLNEPSLPILLDLLKSIDLEREQTLEELLDVWLREESVRKDLGETKTRILRREAQAWHAKSAPRSGKRTMIHAICVALLLIQSWSLALPVIAAPTQNGAQFGNYGPPLYTQAVVPEKDRLHLAVNQLESEQLRSIGVLARNILADPSEAERFRTNPQAYFSDRGLGNPSLNLNAYETRLAIALASPTVRNAVQEGDARALVVALEEEIGPEPPADPILCWGVLVCVGYILVAVHSIATVTIQVAAAAAYWVAIAVEVYGPSPTLCGNVERYLTPSEMLMMDVGRSSGDEKLVQQLRLEVAQKVWDRAQQLKQAGLPEFPA